MDDQPLACFKDDSQRNLRLGPFGPVVYVNSSLCVGVLSFAPLRARFKFVGGWRGRKPSATVHLQFDLNTWRSPIVRRRLKPPPVIRFLLVGSQL